MADFILAKKTTIQKTIAFFLIVVFAVSATPKFYFHAFLPAHKDVTACKEPNKAQAHFHQQGFDCHFDQLVVAVPYLVASLPPLSHLAAVYAVTTCLLSFSPNQACLLCKESRGPPEV